MKKDTKKLLVIIVGIFFFVLFRVLFEYGIISSAIALTLTIGVAVITYFVNKKIDQHYEISGKSE